MRLFAFKAILWSKVITYSYIMHLEQVSCRKMKYEILALSAYMIRLKFTLIEIFHVHLIFDLVLTKNRVVDN